jgi:hypothetical protein
MQLSWWLTTFQGVDWSTRAIAVPAAASWATTTAVNN